MRAESAVEPTKSENITVTWRRSARSSGCALGALDVVAASTEGALPLASLRRAAMASSSFTAVPERRDAKLLQVLVPSGSEEPSRLSHSRGMPPRTSRGPGSAARPQRP